MICRICTLTETNKGVPRKNQFAANVDHVSQQGNSGFYVCYRTPRNKRLKNIYILWKHSATLYAVYTKKSRKDELEAAPLNGLKLRPYCNQSTHGWRIFSADGTDSAIDPMTGSAIGAVVGRLVTLAAQPPATVNATHPFTDANYATFSITKIVPSVPSTLGVIDLVATAQNTADADDDPSEGEELDTLVNPMKVVAPAVGPATAAPVERLDPLVVPVKSVTPDAKSTAVAPTAPPVVEQTITKSTTTIKKTAKKKAKPKWQRLLGISKRNSG